MTYVLFFCRLHGRSLGLNFSIGQSLRTSCESVSSFCASPMFMTNLKHSLKTNLVAISFFIVSLPYLVKMVSVPGSCFNIPVKSVDETLAFSSVL